MINAKIFAELAENLSKVVPSSLHSINADLTHHFRGVIQDYFAKLNLVTREEFDLQTQVLAKTRAKLTALEQLVATLEAEQATPSTKK